MAEIIEAGLNKTIPYKLQLMDFELSGQDSGFLIVCMKKGRTTEFVTWAFSNAGGNFSLYWGHYFPVWNNQDIWKEYGNAYCDFYDRAGIDTSLNATLETMGGK